MRDILAGGPGFETLAQAPADLRSADLREADLRAAQNAQLSFPNNTQNAPSEPLLRKWQPVAVSEPRLWEKGGRGLARQPSSLPIGVFDSGIGGLTVVREIAARLPQESIVYFGDTQRCPYGPRSLHEVEGFALEISRWLVQRQVKLIVIACNSATAAGLEAVQRAVEVPVIGVIEPGARAAVHVTSARRVGVIGTLATIESGAYTRAIRALDAGITVFSAATPRFVEIVEQGLRLDRSPLENIMAQAASIYVRPAFAQIARDYLDPLKRCHIDTLVLGCTHYPLLTPLIRSIMGSDVNIVSSAAETALDVVDVLRRRRLLARSGAQPHYSFATTGADLETFTSLGQAIFSQPIADLELVECAELLTVHTLPVIPATPRSGGCPPA